MKFLDNWHDSRNSDARVAKAKGVACRGWPLAASATNSLRMKIVAGDAGVHDEDRCEGALIATLVMGAKSLIAPGSFLAAEDGRGWSHGWNTVAIAARGVAVVGCAWRLPKRADGAARAARFVHASPRPLPWEHRARLARPKRRAAMSVEPQPAPKGDKRGGWGDWG